MRRTAITALAAVLAVGTDAFATPTLAHARRSTRAHGGVPQLCMRSGGREETRPGRRAVLRGAASLGVATAFSGKASAKKTNEKPCAPGTCVKASSPGIALDMIITMKAAKAMREAGEQLEAGEFKALDTWLTNAFASNSFAFIKKTKVLESLATSLLGVSVADDFEDDPSFNSEESIDSKQVSLARARSLSLRPPSLPPSLPPSINVLLCAAWRQAQRAHAGAWRLETQGTRIMRVRARFAMHAGLARTCLCPSPCACL